MRIAVLGAGTMGHGIAQACAQAGFEVRLHDIDEGALQRALERVHSSLERLAAKGRIPPDAVGEIGARIRRTTDLPDAVGGADVVIEAVPERLALKLDLFHEIDRQAPAEALLATNTSSLSVTELAGATMRPEAVVGLHFFNPVPLMELVEVIRGLRTDDAAVERAKTFVQAIHKKHVVVRDWPGFATSRLGVALGAEAIRMVEQGVASPEDIDRAMELGYRHPMGPLRLTDLIGLDVRLAIMEHLHRELGEQFRPPTLLRQMVRAGKLGRKTGEGFYRYD
ncbi:MAG: 3-hydroxyacyl-CoA dehydrogenase family protein [Myxococcota bacterium]